MTFTYPVTVVRQKGKPCKGKVNMKKRTLFSLAGLLLLAGVLFIWFGVYNIAATDRHWLLTTELLEVVRERSIQVRSGNIAIPDIMQSEYLARGAENYAAMCVQCHLAPGHPPTELHRGLYPQPPVFHEPGHDANNQAAKFWVIKNGVKLTAMPAWGLGHSDKEIWGLVAFISQLPDMSAEEYRQVTSFDGETPGDKRNNDTR